MLSLLLSAVSAIAIAIRGQVHTPQDMFRNDIDSLNLRVQAMRGIQRYMDIDPAMPTTGLFGLKVETLICSMTAFGIIL